MSTAISPRSVLESHFGYHGFRPLQEEIIEHLLAGGDALVLMPTGGGKSLCYQLPALCLPGMTLVVSPLIALMKDQVDALNANKISARFINSSLTASEIEQVQARALRGQIKILYVAPERFASAGFRRFLNSVNLSLIAIDEAHCISEWGHEFRPDYRNLRQLRVDFPRVPVVALTATATEKVRNDIIEQLGLQRGRVFQSSFNRENLTYSVESKEGHWAKLLALLKNHQGESTIIYCFSRQETQELAEDLKERGFHALPYHAGLEPEVRRHNQDAFIRGRVPIIVATIAFGMGIDKPDIRLIVHHSLPKSMEGYYQETGRAGRDGLPSECVLLYSYADRAKHEYFISRMEDPPEQQNARVKLSQIVEYAELPLCRRRALLEYFGETWEADNCGNCDVCLAIEEEFDATELAQKILSAVIRTGERFGAMHVIKVLKGSREKRILDLGHDRLSVYGIVKDRSESELREIFALLRARGFLHRTEGEFAVLAVTGQGRQFLKERMSIALPRLKPADETAGGTSHGTRRGRGQIEEETANYDAALFEELRSLRRSLADAGDVPPFVIFGDAALRYMSTFMPQSLESFSRIPGVGRAKLEQYGEQFVAAIRAYAGARGLPDHTAEISPRRRTAGPEPPGKQDRPPSDRAVERRGSTYQQTREMLEKGFTVPQIAQERNLAEATVVGHLERLAGQGLPLTLGHLVPDEDGLRQVRRALDICGWGYLKPVWEYLGSEFTYDELRLARIFLRREMPDDDTE